MVVPRVAIIDREWPLSCAFIAPAKNAEREEEVLFLVRAELQSIFLLLIIHVAAAVAVA